MQTQPDNGAEASGYAIMCLAICNIAIIQIQQADMRLWLILTCTATAGMIASRLWREGVFGRELQTRAELTPPWQVFGLGIVLFAAEMVIVSYITDSTTSRIIRSIFAPLSFAFIFAGLESAIFRKSILRTNPGKPADRA